MDHEQFDILLSAYLDGELTADEQLRVEQLLASSAEARQLVEELRALRAGLQALPQHRLEPNFAERVLRRAEAESQPREIGVNDSRIANRESAAAAIEPESHNDIEESSRETIPSRRFWLNPRGIAWAAVAATIAFMITAVNPPDKGKDVAKAPEEKAAQVARQAKQEASQLRNDPVADARDGQKADLGLAKDRLTETHDYSLREGSVVTGNRGLDEVADAPKTAATSPSQPSGDAAAVEGKLTLSKETAAASGGEKVGDPIPASPSDVMLVEVQVAPEAIERGEFDRLLAANKIKLDGRFDETGRMQPPNYKKTLSANEFSRGREAAEPADSTKSRDTDFGADSGARGGRTAPSEAETVRQPSRRAEGDTARDDKQVEAQSQFKKNPADAFGAIEADFLPHDELQKLSREGRADLIYVEAAPQQIQSTLDDLQRSPQWFAVSERKTVGKASGEGKPTEALLREKLDASYFFTPNTSTAGAAGASELAGEQNKAGQSSSESEKLAGSGARRGRAGKSEQPSDIWLGRALRLSFADENSDAAAKPSTAGKLAEAQSERRQNVPQPRGGGFGGQQNGQQRFGGGGGMGGAPAGSVAPAASAPPPVSGPASQSPPANFKRDFESGEITKDTDRIRALGRLEVSGKASNAESRKVLFVLRAAPPVAGSALNAAASPTPSEATKPAASSPVIPPVAAPSAK